MKNSLVSVKIKVFLGYITLIILASLVIWVIYTEILQNSGEKVDFRPSDNKIHYINNILTNLYQAEGLERNYSQTGQAMHYQDYLSLMDTIRFQIDTLASMIDNPIQKLHTDSIKKLLNIKQQNLKELYAIKKSNSSTAMYRQGLKKIPAIKDSIKSFTKVYTNVTVKKDSVYVKQKKKKFFERLANVFAPQKKADSSLHISTSQLVKVDSLRDKGKTADTITGFITSIISEIRDESEVVETKLKEKEQEVLINDRTITMQLRLMLSNIEKEELFNSFQKVKDQQDRIEKATILIILVGIFALFIIVFFLVNILNDITRSQKLRLNLEKSKAFAESLLKSKEQFMLSLTHDLKSPLNSITGYAEFLGEDPEISGKQRQYLNKINKASSHILKLVNDLLDLARLETGKLAIEHLNFNFQTLIEDVVDGFRQEANKKGIALILENIETPDANYQSDPVRITQILGNLISNAIKFTEEGSVRVKVSVLRSSEKTDLFQLEVIDSGIGISEENNQFVFEEFARVTTTQKQYEGTGLGLTITQKIVQLLQGTIKLESKPDEGSHFTVTLPLEKESSQDEVAVNSVNEKSAEVRFALAGKRVWLVDHDETLLEMTTTILKSVGMEVHPFNDPNKAIKSFKSGYADFLVTDIQMPVMSGIEVQKQIRKKNGGHIVSFAISGNAPENNEYSEFTAFIQKPFKAQTLIDVISGHQVQDMPIENSKAFDENGNNGYNLEQLAAFAAGDPESLQQILVSLIHSGKQNVSIFRRYVDEENMIGVSELAHKMLTIFRQLQASEIVNLLAILERKDFSGLNNKQFFTLAIQALEKIEDLLQIIQEEQKVIA